ncbi:GDSL esterase/lipase At5g14450-like isoform X2 [Telopea speciosissima]|uniref:GDSL esterase/lipase At5g14450-like isoform X2 n=1 Tax=Telopea speciosissima TaxID=54955 RepID=UPI001CC7B4AE|nr:GDSL esterase/lipase At5g14450-like isoform X2 [Telopea speciosissima]
MALGWFGIRRVIWGCPCPLFGLLVLGLMGMGRVAVVESLNLSSSSTSKFSSCEFPAIYNFGDSNSDTGARSAAFDAIPPPNGETFFGKPSGRSCDGRLIIDFIAEELGLPYLSAYLDSIGTSFRKGANFAAGGASIRQGGYSPFHLDIQISQFQQFKARSLQQLAAACKNNLPRPEDFSKALYTFDIGQNDLSYGFQHTSEDQVRASVPDILDQFSSAIQRLYEEGARTFWVHNTGPVGCLPYAVIYYPNKDGSHLDQNGCVRTQNEVAQDFNRQLLDRITLLRTQFPLAVFTYVDVYYAKYDLITNAMNQGFVDPLKFCCGSYYGYHVDCGKKAVINGTVYGNACENPSSYVSWDGIHYSQEANRRVAIRIFNGSLSHPPIPITKACHASSSS